MTDDNDRDLRDAFRALGTAMHGTGPTFAELTSEDALVEGHRVPRVVAELQVGVQFRGHGANVTPRADTHETRTLEGAAAELSQRLRSLLPGSTCAEWKWLASPPAAAPEVPAAAPDASTFAPAAAPDTSAAGAPAE